jgi:putative transposase
MLEASESGLCAWRSPPPSERAIRHAWLTDLVTEIRAASRQTCGSIRVHSSPGNGLGMLTFHPVRSASSHVRSQPMVGQSPLMRR